MAQKNGTWKHGKFFSAKAKEAIGANTFAAIDSPAAALEAINSAKYLQQKTADYKKIINEPMTSSDGKMNFNSYQTLQALNMNRGQMARSLADEYFPKGTRITLLEKGTENVFEVTGYHSLKNGLREGGTKRAVIPSLKRISGNDYINPGYGQKKAVDTVRDMGDLAFKAAFAKGLGVNLTVKVKQP